MLEKIEKIESNSNFVQPYWIVELVSFGLSAADIAKSLNVAASALRQKLTNRNFIDRIRKQGYQAITTVRVNKINGLEYTEYFLDVEAAKFFVAKYDNDIGDAYLRFLISVETQAKQIEILSKTDPIMAEIAYTQKLRLEQIRQEQKLNEHDYDINELKLIAENSYLTVPQKTGLKKIIDSTAIALGDYRFIGYIQRDLKRHFGLNATNDKWYHIKQSHYEEALNFVRDWNRE